MGDAIHWSVQIGRWRRSPIRLHATFLATAVFVVFLASLNPGPDASLYGVLGVLVLLGSVLAHELGHAFAAARVGGGGETIVIGPLGGLADFEFPREPQSELIVLLAGPLVNLAALLLALPILLAAQIDLSPLLSLWQPTGLLEGPWWEVCLKLTFWVNWLILVVNLLPAFPLDGAKILRAMLWPALDYRSAAQLAVRTSKVTALAICFLAWMLSDVKAGGVIPVWMPLVWLAIFLYFAARHDGAQLEEGPWDDEMLGYDFSQGYTSLERSLDAPRQETGFVRRWLINRRELRHRRQQTQELDEERQVDEILIRLHEKGMGGLSAKERALLHRVSARYRSRPGR